MPPSAQPHRTFRRFDFGGQLLRKSFQRDSDGALLCEGIPVREGILVYRNADGSETRELVTRAAVEDTARSIARAPVTLEHPDEGFVDPDNFGGLGVGDVDGEASVEEDAQGGFARVKLAIRRRDAIEAAQSDKSELSPGYIVQVDPTPGIHPIFGRYDARQIGRQCNHLAIVGQGRGGPTVRLRADSGDAVMVKSVAPPAPAPAPAGSTPKQAPRADQEFTVNPKLAALAGRLDCKVRTDMDDAAVLELIQEALQAREAALAEREKDVEEAKADEESEYADMKAGMDALCDMLDVKKGDMKALHDAVGKMKADKEAEKGRADGLQSKLDEIEADAQAKADAAELAGLQELATKVGVKHDGLDLPALRVAIAKTRVDSVTADKGDAYIGALIDVVRKDATKPGKDDRYDGFRKPGDDNANRNDGADPGTASLYAH